MSKGLGKTQLAVMEAFNASPKEWLSVSEVANYAFNSAAPGAAELASVRRALVKVIPIMDLHCRRFRLEAQLGWKNKYMKYSELAAIFTEHGETPPRKLNR